MVGTCRMLSGLACSDGYHLGSDAGEPEGAPGPLSPIIVLLSTLVGSSLGCNLREFHFSRFLFWGVSDGKFFLD